MMQNIYALSESGYTVAMKPTVPETGKVIKTDDGMAVVMLDAGGSCKGCGAAELGICKPSGNISILTVKNTADARIGDTVRVGIDRPTQVRGFLLAFVVPLFSLTAGSLAGYILGEALSIPSAEVICGFLTFLGGTYLSFRRLKRLDRASSVTIQQILPSGDFSTDPHI